MASPFQKYQGGGFDLPNIAQVGANIGETYQRGISDFGKSIGEGIKAYDSGIMQNKAADAKLAAAIRNTGMLASALEMHPDYKDIAGSLAAKLEEYKNVTGKGLGPKLAAINDLETSSQSIQQAIQYQNMAAEAMAARAYEETPYSKTINAHGVLAEMGYNPGVTGSLDKAIQRLLAQVNKNNAEQGVKPGDVGYTDPQQSLNELLGRARLGLKQAVAQDPKNLTLLNAEGELEGAVKRYAGIEKLRSAGGLSDIGSGILDIYKGVAQQYGATTAMEPEVSPESLPYNAEKVLPAQIDAFSTPAERARAKAIQNLTPEQRAKLAERDAIVEGAAKSDEQQRLSSYTKDVNVAEGLNLIVQKLEAGQQITNADLDLARGMAAGLSIGESYRTGLPKGNVQAVEAFNKLYGKYAKRIEGLMMPTTQSGDMYTPEYRADAPILAPSPEQKSEILKLKQELQTKIVELTSEKGKDLDVNRQAVSEQLFPETKFATEKPVRAQLDITANRAVEQQVTPDERMALAKEALAKSDYVQKRFGGKIPAAALQALQSKILTPPAMITDPATGARLYQSSPGKWEQLKVDKPDATMQVNQTLFSPGHESITAGRQKQFAIQGTFKGGNEKEKTVFIAQTQKRARALTSIDRLLEINEKPGEGLRPTLIGEAETIVNEIISSNRVDLIGPGQVAVAEWQMLEKLVRNPAKLVELDSITKSNLMRLRQRMQDVMYDEAYANGLTLTPMTSGAEVGRGIRMQNLVNRVPQQ